MFTVGDAIDICIKLVPTAQSLYLQDRRNKRDSENEKLRITEFSKLQGAIPKHSGSNEPKLKKGSDSGTLPEGWEEGESIEDLGHRFWLGYHAAVDSLPDDAEKSQVQKMLKQIEKNVRVFPCPSCRENAIDILENDPLVKPGIETKQDAQIALCNFHNHISEHLGKETVSCEQTYA